MTYLLAHDVGTSGSKAALYTSEGEFVASSVSEYPTYYPAPGCAEQNPEFWYAAVCSSTKALLETNGISPGDVAALSFSGQMMGCVPVLDDGSTPDRVMIWADNRSAAEAKRLGDSVGAQKLFRIAGARPSPSYSGSKIMWLRDNLPEIYNRTKCVLQPKDYICYRLTGELLTDYSDASGSNMFDITKKEWSDELIYAAGLNRDIFPEAFPSTHKAGVLTESAAGDCGLIAGTPVVIGAGDGAAAAVGSGIWKSGTMYSSVGSSAWVSMASDAPLFDDGMQTYNLIHPDGVHYAPCCSMQACGYSFNRLRANFFPGMSYDDMTAEAVKSPAGANGLCYLPYLMGERCPRWNPDAVGALVGLTLSTSRADIVRAVMEGAAYNLRAIIDIFGSLAPDEIIMVSGCASSDLWQHIFADVFGRRVNIPSNTGEATAIGAAVCAGVGIGLYDDFSACEKFNRIVKTVEPSEENKAVYDTLFNAFNLAYDGLAPVFPYLR